MAVDNRTKCPVCQAASSGDWTHRRLAPQAPIYGENPKGRAQAAKIRKQNSGGK